MRRSSLLCALLALALLTGCAGAVPEVPPPTEASKDDGVTPGGQETDPAAPQKPALPEGAVVEAAEGAEVRYTLDQPITVDGGRALTLRLHCRAAASGYGTYGVGAMDVLEGETLLQTICVGDAIRSAEAAEGIEDGGGDGWTHCFEGAYLPETVDLNFDGAEDLRLMEFLGTVNGRYHHWLWDPEAEQFVYAFCLVGYDFQIDSQARHLVTEARGGFGSYYTDTYDYDGGGVLRHIRQEHQELLGEGGPAVVTVHELIGGEWVQTKQEKRP